MEKGLFKLRPAGERSPFWWFRWVPTVVVSAITLYILYVVGSVVVVPLLASVALAYLLNPLVVQLEKRGMSRVIAAAAALFLVTAAIVGFLAYIVPDLWTQGSRAGAQVIESFTPENAERQRAWLRRYSPALERMAGNQIEQFLGDPRQFYADNIDPPKAKIDEEGNIVQSTGSRAIVDYLISGFDLLLVPFFVFYILVDFRRWRDSLEDLIPPRFREPFSRLFDESGRILESYVRGQLLIGLIMAVFYGIGFYLVGVPAWAGIALIAGLLNAIPYFGTVIGFLLAAGFTLAQGGGTWELAGVLGVFVAVQSLEGYILTPKILGGRLNLHPMAVFLGLLVGGKLYGLLGMVLAIPTIAIGKVFLKFLRELYESSYFYTAKTPNEGANGSDNDIETKIADAADTVLAEQKSEDVEDAKDQQASNTD
ncbi:MAG: AI-2E family transporter [Blastocatellia bacterium]|nr:AI-2E family transporter [Blastocatellia bacterium]